MDPEVNGTDFIATELLKELKEENERKSSQIHNLQSIVWKTIVAAFILVVAIVGGMLIYLYQYDFFDASYETTTKTAEGVYAIIDSEGNVIGHDLTQEQIQQLLEGSVDSGTSDSNND